MITGKTEIILQDVNTGETKKILEHNMVTNALNDIFRQEGYMKNSTIMFGSNFQPIYSTLLGGILLFDTAIPENASDYFPSGGVNLTACGVYGVQNSTADILRGNYNSDESKYSSNDGTMKYVYDFPTSKGNGTIASVCLTSKYGGYSSYGAATNGEFSQNSPLLLETGTRGAMNSSTSEAILTVDIEQDIVYTAELTISNSYLTALTFRKRRAYMKSLSPIFNANTAGSVIESRLVDIDPIWSGYSRNYDKSANAVYYCGCTSNATSVSNGGTFRIVSIPLATFIPQTYTVTNNSGETIYANNAFVYRGYVYAVSSDNTKAYKISLTDGSCTAITAEESTAFSYLKYAIAVGDHIYVQSNIGTGWSYKLYVIDTVTNTAKPTQNYFDGKTAPSYCRIPLIGSNVMTLVCRDGYADNVTFSAMGNYLATINNLAAPVTKTETQTMKVIYTITENSL